MSLLRPGQRDWLTRWREPLMFGAGTLALSLLALRIWWRGDMVFAALYGLAALGCAVLCRAALARVRLAPRRLGPGVVKVIERRIGYFGPFGGGFSDIDALTRIEIVATSGGPAAPDVFWRLWGEERLPLEIPASATGAESLFEAFAPLTGIDWEGVLRAMGGTGDRVVLVWERPGAEAADLPRPRHLSIQP